MSNDVSSKFTTMHVKQKVDAEYARSSHSWQLSNVHLTSGKKCPINKKKRLREDLLRGEERLPSSPQVKSLNTLFLH